MLSWQMHHKNKLNDPKYNGPKKTLYSYQQLSMMWWESKKSPASFDKSVMICPVCMDDVICHEAENRIKKDEREVSYVLV